MTARSEAFENFQPLSQIETGQIDYTGAPVMFLRKPVKTVNGVIALALLAAACGPVNPPSSVVSETQRAGATQLADCPPPLLCKQPDQSETPIPIENQVLSANLRILLGVSPTFTRLELMERGLNLQYSDGSWIYNSMPDGKSFIMPSNRALFAKYRNSKGNLIGVGMDGRGELQYTIPTLPETSAVLFPPVETPIYSRPVIFGDNIIGIYGSKEVVESLVAKWQDNASVRRFLNGYFGGESTLSPDGKGRKIIHLILAPQNYGPISLNGNFGIVIDPNASGAKNFETVDDQENYVGTDVIFNLNRLYNESQSIDIDHFSDLISTFADERANFLAARRGIDLHQTSENIPHTEAYSALCGLLAYLDPEMRETLLGTKDFDFLIDLVNVMQELAKKGKTQSSILDSEDLGITISSTLNPFGNPTFTGNLDPDEDGNTQVSLSSLQYLLSLFSL